MTEKNYVTYEDFGAVGDGVADDFFAMKAAHEYANKNRLSVKGVPGKSYLIHETYRDGAVQKIDIRTDTDWQGAEIIVDDSDIAVYDERAMHAHPVITVSSDYEPLVIEDKDILSRLAGVGDGTKKINLALGYPALLVLENANHRVFRRYGKSYGKQMLGAVQSELIVVDGEGNVDESTPFMFNYSEMTKLTVIRTDIKPITVGNGVMTTRACHVNIKVTENGEERIRKDYYSRGLTVNRSHTLVKNVEHRVVGEVTLEEQAQGILGPAYFGFFYANTADEVTFEDCILQGRRYFKVNGTYDFGGRMVNKIRLVNCVQSNFYMENEKGERVTSMAISELTGTRICWGIGGTNYCKNMEYIGCTLSRFDAHAGLVNGKIIDTNINFIALTGKGNMLIENTKLVNIGGTSHVDRNMVYLRDDYGSIWQGDIVIKDCEIETDVEEFMLLNFTYRNHDFGYTCYFPNVVVDNLKLTNGEEKTKLDFVRRQFFEDEPGMHLDKIEHIHKRDEEFEEILDDFKNYNKTVTPDYIKFINNKENYTLYLVDSPFFDNTETVGNIVKNDRRY